MNIRMPVTSRLRVGLLSALCVAGVLAGCSEELPPSGPHPALSADQVKIYQKKPAKYELLGKIEVPITEEMKWDERGDSTPGFIALQSKAGAMGANGVLLELSEKDYDFLVGAGFKGARYQVPMHQTPRTAIAAAIYVIKE